MINPRGIRAMALSGCYIDPNVLRAKIKSIEITEVPDLNPESYVPDDCEDFQCTFGVSIGPSDAEGAELFYLTVAHPSG